MKKTLIILVVFGFIIAVSSSAFAYSFTFANGDSTALAIMELKISGNTLDLELGNKSPMYSSNASLNKACITEFGFDFLDNNPIQTPLSWQMSAYRYNTTSATLSDSAIVIGGNPNANLDKWTISYDRNFPGAGMKLDYVPENWNGNKNALYNPLLAGQSLGTNSEPFFTTAFLTMTFANPFEVELSSIWVKMQRVGPNEASFEMNGVQHEQPQVPEPGTMFLLGSLATGLFGFAGLRRRFTK